MSFASALSVLRPTLPSCLALTKYGLLRLTEHSFEYHPHPAAPPIALEMAKAVFTLGASSCIESYATSRMLAEGPTGFARTWPRCWTSSGGANSGPSLTAGSRWSKPPSPLTYWRRAKPLARLSWSAGSPLPKRQSGKARHVGILPGTGTQPAPPAPSPARGLAGRTRRARPDLRRVPGRPTRPQERQAPLDLPL